MRKRSREPSLIKEYLKENKIGGTVVWEFQMTQRSEIPGSALWTRWSYPTNRGKSIAGAMLLMICVTEGGSADSA